MAIQPSKDIVMIGYGAAAGPISTELAKQGMSVLALERGPWRDLPEFAPNQFDTLRHVTRAEMVPPPQEQAMTFREDLNARAEPTRNRMAATVGGASVHWSAQSWRYYEEDFQIQTKLTETYTPEQLAHLDEDGASIVNWPISYDDLEPHYDKTEYYIGVGGFPGNIQGAIRPVVADEGNPFEAPRQRDYPYRPIRDNATDITFREGALALGLNPFHVPTAITTEAYTNPDGLERAACTYCPFCTSHGCWNHSKSTSQSALLPTALETGNFEVRPLSHVLRINHENGRAVSVDYIDLVTGEQHTQPGDVFYVGAYSHQNVRLLLYSGITGGGQVGKYFLNRAGPSVSAIYDDRYLNGYAGPAVQRQGLDDYNEENALEAKLQLPADEFFVRGGFIGSPSQRNPLETYGAKPPEVPTWGLAYKEYFSENLNRYIGLQFLPEPIAYETSYIDLDPNYSDRYGVPAARVQRQAKQNEIRMAKFLYDRGMEILTASGASQVWGNPVPRPVASMTHDCGGTRMGDDPTTSATNRYGQLWEIPNIMVGGGSLFPSLSGHNPTETIWALSYWQAAAVLENRIDFTDSQAFS